ncbi:hypothetical protein Taro_033782, partial [Colocasia esculenta]|nr:hypothetical protein [Colocasia esculenta]
MENEGKQATKATTTHLQVLFFHRHLSYQDAGNHTMLELLDLPPSGQASSAASSGECPSGLVSLKIAMGKTEFQTRDKGDFLLCQNYYSGGEEILGCFISTGWGWREAVLKRKHGKLPRSDSKDSVAALNVTENVIGASANIITEEGHMADQLPVKSQVKHIYQSDNLFDAREKGLFASLAQDLPQQPKNHCEEGAISQPKANEEASVYQANQNSIRETNVSSEAMDPQLRCTGSLVSREIGGTSSSPSAMPQEEIKVSTTKESAHEKFSVTDTKKLISALGNISLQMPSALKLIAGTKNSCGINSRIVDEKCQDRRLFEGAVARRKEYRKSYNSQNDAK